jgi:hypothetical protein
MSDQRRAAHDASSIDRDRGRRNRRTAGTRPSNTLAVVRLGPAAPAPSPGAGRRPDDRVQRETTLVGALQLVEDGLAAAEESYRRVLAVFEASLGEEHPEVADVHRRLSVAEQARGHGAEAEYHARRAREIDRTLGAVPLRRKADRAVGALT